MQTYILTSKLRESRSLPKEKISVASDTLSSDLLNTLLAKGLGNANIVSGVFAFADRPAIRYRNILPTRRRRTLAADRGFANLIYDWIMNGVGDAFVCFSRRSSASFREIQPYKVSEDTYFFFDGRYGTGDLWTAIRDARTQKQNIPQVIHDKFCEVGSYSAGGLHLFRGTLEEWLNGECEDEFPFSNSVLYAAPEDLRLPRPYRIWVWKNGGQLYDEYFKSGYNSGTARVFLDRVAPRFLNDVEDEFDTWEGVDGIRRWRL